MTVSLLVATRNKGKLAELRELVADLGVTLLSLDEVRGAPRDVVEDGATFEDNARKKALEYARATGLPTLADDSGLEVDALAGEPGVRSARFAGARATDGENNRLLLSRLEEFGGDERTARFRCVLAFADLRGPLGEAVHLARGVCEGRILSGPRGASGFGYDPLFVPEVPGDRTLAELRSDEKNAISHRAEASRQMVAFLREYLGDRPEEPPRRSRRVSRRP
jgi:XTP/dITP diphosphohydrolase